MREELEKLGIYESLMRFWW